VGDAVTKPDDLPDLPDLADELPDLAHDQLRHAYQALRAHVARHTQQFRDRDEAAADRLDITQTTDGWTWTRYDGQGRALAHGDVYSRKADALRGGQRANPDL
jgi:hypothetical protein